MVPLIGTNRIFVRHGLQQMQANNRPGLLALAHVCGLKSLDEVTPAVISYKMAPRLNAAGRIGNAIKGVELLLEQNYENALKMAEELNLTNEYRQKLEAEIFEQAIRMVEEGEVHKRSAIILHSENWHPGVIGIVASRLVERYYKPTIMISLEGGVGRGSARSIQSLHIYNVLEELNGLLVQYGGHKFAAGLTINESNLPEFIRRFEQIVDGTLTDEDYRNVMEIDAPLELSRLTPELVVALSSLEPFGMNNGEPNFLATGLTIKKQNIINRAHLHWRLQSEGVSLQFNAIGFGLASERQLPTAGDRVDIVYFPRINVFNGNVSLQLYVKDYRSAQ
jgi:single-stranded-DNA-specific exonuclease